MKKRSRRRSYRILPALVGLCAAAVMAVQFPASCRADENMFLAPDYFGRVFQDLVELPQKPFHWDSKEWLIAGGIIAATAAAFTVDGDIRDSFGDKYEENRSGFFKELSDVTTSFGDYKYQAPIILGSWVGGLVFRNDTLKKIAADGAEASLIAAGILNPAICYLSGRRLPNYRDENGEPDDPMNFEPFHSERYSFPSGHTAEAFTMAAVIDINLRKHYGYWQTPLLYGLAASVGVSRIYDHKHYLSDVILGAGIGWSVGTWISSKPRNLDNVTLLPSTKGLQIVWAY